MAKTTTHNLIFSHPALSDDLEIDVKPDSITWSYNLNTTNYPTFGGEVVQILSMFVEDMTITGMVSSYKKMEKIYGWFVAYMQRATQGKTQAYDTTPVTVYYPHRGWKFLIQPKSTPGFQYGRDVVAPTWSVTAAVVESPDSFQATLKSDIEQKAMQDEGFQPFGTATARIGYSAFNPWSAPNTGKTYKEGATREYYAQQGDANGPFNSFMKSWVEGGATFAEAMAATSSKPALLSGGQGSTMANEAALRTQRAGQTITADDPHANDATGSNGSGTSSSGG
jgi:hypothetical protein